MVDGNLKFIETRQLKVDEREKVLNKFRFGKSNEIKLKQ